MAFAILLLAGCATRWDGLPQHYSEDGELGIQVSEIVTGAGGYDLRAHVTNLISFQSDPLQIKAPQERALRSRAAMLCAPRKPEVISVAQQPPISDVFMHVECR
jgi:hypothetical protein